MLITADEKLRFHECTRIYSTVYQNVLVLLLTIWTLLDNTSEWLYYFNSSQVLNEQLLTSIYVSYSRAKKNIHDFKTICQIYLVFNKIGLSPHIASSHYCSAYNLPACLDASSTQADDAALTDSFSFDYCMAPFSAHQPKRRFQKSSDGQGPGAGASIFRTGQQRPLYFGARIHSAERGYLSRFSPRPPTSMPVRYRSLAQ
jgi:hypothetical protein